MSRLFFSAFLILVSFSFNAQEVLKPLSVNLSYFYDDLKVSPKDNTKDNNVTALKTQSTSLFIPFIDDFYYAPISSYPDPNKWTDSSAYVNSGFPRRPPSIGVATFDGLNKNGYPYKPNLVNNTISFASDVLTSQPINLLVTTTSQTLQPADSVALSFYYQARGYGDGPELSDSLVLDFYKPVQNQWNRVWFKLGNANSNLNDTNFKRGFVWVSDTAYLRDGFKFRFRNWSAATGDFDHWHLDYVYLDKDRSMKADTIYKDLTFGYVPTPFLRDYSAMPYQQFIPSEMAANSQVKIANNGPSQINMTYEYKIEQGSQVLNSYTGGAYGLFPFRDTSYSNYAAHAKPAISYTFAALPDSGDFRIKHYVFESGSPTDFIRENDTVIQYQKFRNYYAIDDGGAEAGYYINAAAAKIAVKINVNVPDSFLGMRIYFDPAGGVAFANGSLGFRIAVWSPGPNGGPGGLLFRDTIQRPKYYNQPPERAFAEYRLIRQKLLQPGTYYIGIQQLADYMTIGFDRNTDHSSTTFYDAGAGWQQSAEQGSIMIRPIFGKTLPPYVGVNEISHKENIFTIYPNPTSDLVFIRSDQNEKVSCSLINSLGQSVQENFFEGNMHQLNTSNLSSGIYFLILKTGDNTIQQQKIIIQH